jgi:hypothetical protein
MVMLAESAFAADVATYDIDELDMSISLPSDDVIFTRDINASDPNLDKYELTKDSMSSYMTSRDIYLDAWDPDVNYQILVRMIESPFEDFNLLGDETLSTVASTVVSAYQDAGVTCIKSDVYQHAQAKFLKMYISQPYGDGTAYGLQYYTAYADKVIIVTLHSYTGIIDDSKESILKGIVDSVQFDTAPKLVEKESGTMDNGLNIGFIFISLLITIAIYSLPIMIYRYAIKKSPIEPKKAKKISIIYGIAAFIVMFALILIANGSATWGGGILLWSYVNYRVLIGGKKPSAGTPSTAVYESNPVELTKENIEAEKSKDLLHYEILYCHKCGNKLLSGSMFCDKCGAKIPVGDDKEVLK